MLPVRPAPVDGPVEQVSSSSSLRCLFIVHTTTIMSALANDTETQPLLAKDPQRRATPLPKFQLALICFLRITEPIAFLVCFPFLNQMLLDVGAVDDPKDVGWPAGIVCSHKDNAEARSNRYSPSPS